MFIDGCYHASVKLACQQRVPTSKAGLTTREEMKVDCRYVLRDKVWITNPDGTQWEVFAVTFGAAKQERMVTEKRMDFSDLQIAAGRITVYRRQARPLPFDCSSFISRKSARFTNKPPCPWQNQPFRLKSDLPMWDAAEPDASGSPGENPSRSLSSI